MDAPALDNAELYINRELSLLAFNRRVLEQARFEGTPLLERLRFLCISSSNLDEFFEVRVAGLLQQVKYGSVQTGPDNLSPTEQLDRISGVAHEFVEEQYRVLNEEMIPGLENEGIRFLKRSEWTSEQLQWIASYFDTELLPIVTPMRLDPAHPFPQVLNKGLHFIVSLRGRDAFGQSGGMMAVVQAPRPLPRIIRVPSTMSRHPHEFVFLSSVIHAHVGDLFSGIEVTGCYQFRVTRNSDLFVDHEEVDDLLRAMEGELPARRYGDAVRLEVTEDCPGEIVEFLEKRFGLAEQGLYRVDGPVNLHRLAAVPDLVDRPDLKYPSFTPGFPEGLTQNADMFEAISARDILLHHPFESFAPVVDLVRQAASDPNVLAIKQTLYRTAPGSVVVDELVSAAEAGKEVAVCVELRARFDEEANISLASRLQRAGAHVVYGIVGYKTHAKMLLIVRREQGRLRRYVHLGTGNYHDRTARIYTDYGLLTANPEIGEDVHRVFMQLTGIGSSAPKLAHLIDSPFALHREMVQRIDREIDHQGSGLPARIIAKMNALAEPKIIAALYRASQAGVRVDLIVRGICMLRPGIPGVSENITVRSIVGRFLEHTRVFYFHNGGEFEIFCGSADWMVRNLFQRVEVCFPILEEDLKRRVVEQGLTPYLEDNHQAWELDSSCEYRKMMGFGAGSEVNAQRRLLRELAEPSAKSSAKTALSAGAD